jgi:Ca2+-binding RTX toxin-like protein
MSANATAFKLDASDMTGALTATMSANMKDVVGGSGNDVFKGAAVSTAASTIDGGAGNNTFTPVQGGVSSNIGYTLTNIDVIDVNGSNAAVTFLASQLSGKDFIIKGAGTDDVLTIDGNATATNVDLSTIDLSQLTFTAASTTTVNLTGWNGTLFTSTQGFTVTGSAVIDAITGGANADSLSGGAGADTISGAAGADTINGDAGADILGGGAGADIIDGGAGADVITGGTGLNVLTGGAGADTFEMNKTDTAAAVPTAASTSITDFTIGVKGTGDDIGWNATNATVTAATAAASGTAQIATAGAAAVFNAADSTLALKIVAVEAAINASGTAADGQAAHFVDGGNTYIVISNGVDGMAAQDAVIALTGLDASANTLTIDTNHLVLI